MAPILPFLSDSDEQLDATVEAIAAAGAAYVSPIVLHLRPGAREWWQAWLRREHPDLLPRYAELYGERAYAPKAYQRDVSERVHALAARHRVGRRRQLRGGDQRPVPRADVESCPGRHHTQIAAGAAVDALSLSRPRRSARSTDCQPSSYDCLAASARSPNASQPVWVSSTRVAPSPSGEERHLDPGWLGGVGARVPAEHEPSRRARLDDLGPHRALPLGGRLDDLRALDVDPSGRAEDAVGRHRPPGSRCPR